MVYQMLLTDSGQGKEQSKADNVQEGVPCPDGRAGPAVPQEDRG